MNPPTTVRLTDDQIKWVDQMNLNVSKYIRSLIDKDMKRNKVITGTPRHYPYCLICKESYMDFCILHHHIKGSWEMRK